jgi:VWFA-related protein
MTIPSVLRICLTATALAALLPAGAQSTTPAAGQTTPAPTAGPDAASAVGAVTLPVTVMDDKGNPVKNLTAADIKLTDNGEAQTIQSFGPASPTPVAIGIVGQTSAGLRAELGDERLSSVHFVDHTLPGTQDQFFVIDYAGEVDLLADPTATASKLHDAINQMGSPQFGSQNGGDRSDQSSGDTHYGVGGTLYDAIYLAATEEMKKLPGEHVLVVFTDGIDHNSKETMSDAIEAAQAAHMAIFGIYYKSEEQQQQNPNQNNRRTGGGFPGGGGGYPGGGGGYPGGGGGYPGGGGGRRGGQNPTEQPHEDGRQNLIHMCDATGGYMVEGKRDKGDDSYNKIADLLKNRYSLTFVPTKAAQDSDFQRITLTTEKKNVFPKVQEGYTPQQQ